MSKNLKLSILVAVFCCFVSLAKAQTTYYSDPSSVSITLLDNGSSSSGWSTSASGPFASVTISATDNIVIQSGSTVTVNSSAVVACNNLTLNGQLYVGTNTTNTIKFSGLFSGTGNVTNLNASSVRIQNGSNASTISFIQSNPSDNTSGLTLFYNLTLAGNTVISGGISSSTNAVVLDLNNDSLAVINGAMAGATFNSGSAGNGLVIKGSPTSKLSLGQNGFTGTSNIYFDLSNQPYSNSLYSFTTGESTAKLFTPLNIYGFFSEPSGSFFANFPGLLADGVTTTRGIVNFKATASGTAYLVYNTTNKVFNSTAASTNGIIGVEAYQSAKRGWRFIGKPTQTATSLTTLAANCNIDINNGAASSTTVYALDNKQTDGNNVWQPANTWGTFGSTSNSTPQALLVFVRGKSGEGIGNGSSISGYTPSNVTMYDSGAIARGAFNIKLYYDATNPNNSQWNVFNNYFPTPISAYKLLSGAIGSNYINPTIYYFNPNHVTSNAYTADGDFEYVTLSASQDFIVPPMGAIIVQALPAANGQTVQMGEGAKLNSVGVDLSNTQKIFGGNDALQNVTLILTDSLGIVLDKSDIILNNTSTTKSGDQYDLPKFTIGNQFMYLLSSDKKQLAINSLNTYGNDTIPLGIQVQNLQSYSLKVNNYNLPLGATLLLKDKLLNKITVLDAQSGYCFNVTSDAVTQGANRFELLLQTTKTVTAETFDNTVGTLNVSVSPNPVTNLLHVSLPMQTNNSATIIKLIDLNGVIVKQIRTEQNGGVINISTSDLAGGIYVLNVSSGGKLFSSKIIKN